MTRAEYTEGDARAIVRGGTVVLLPAPVDADLVARLWAVLPEASGRPDDDGVPPAGVVAVVGVLAQVAGALTDIPPFAVATWDPTTGTARVAVRGTAASAVVATGSGDVEVTGADVLMWAERVVDDATSVVVRSAGAASPGAAAWPLVGGVIRADAVRLGDLVQGNLVQGGESGAEAPAAAADVPAAPAPADPSAWPVPGQKFVTVPSQETIVGSVDSPAPTPAPPARPVPAGHDGRTDGAAGEATDDDADDGETVSPVSEETVMGDDGDGYEHLFGDTVFRRVEDAAVRVTEDDEGEDEPATAVPAPATPSEATPPAPAPAPEPVPAPLPEPGGLIAEVPGAGTPAAASRAAAISADQAPPSEPGQEPGVLDDHDGHTIMSGELAALREAAGGVPQFDVPAPAGAQDVLALTCSQRHPNPPTREHCRTCNAALEGDPHLVPRPLLGRILVSSGTATGGVNEVDGGQAVDLDRDVVVGRRPRTSTTSADRMPRLVTVASPQQDISRSHVEVTLEEWHVLVEDLATTNGTMLLRPGQEPRRLHPNQKEIIADGDVVELGDGVALTFEGIW